MKNSANERSKWDDPKNNHWNELSWDCYWHGLSWLTHLMRWQCQPATGRSLRALHRYLLLLGSLLILTWSYGNPAQAEAVAPPDLPSEEFLAINPPDGDRLPVPSAAAEIPIGAASEFSDLELPPPPEIPQPPKPTGSAAPLAANLLQSVKTKAASQPVELGFNPPPVHPALPASIPIATGTPAPASASASDTGIPLDQLFIGNSESLVARAVGSAEGTRTPEGDRNPAYYGHVDPGNKAWNLGSFSYQHPAASPEEADAKQLSRLQDQAAVMQSKAEAKGLRLSTEEALNGIDLANQAPKAVLDQDGYVDWLAKAREKGLSGSDAVLWARTQSFLDPNTQQWNAPGLGNTQAGIVHDQQRRMQAIDRALAAEQNPPAAQNPPTQTVQPPPTAQASLPKIPEEIGLARLFTEQMVTRWGGSMTDTVTAAVPSAANSGTGSGTAQVDLDRMDAATAVESPGIDRLFNVNLPAS